MKVVRKREGQAMNGWGGDGSRRQRQQNLFSGSAMSTVDRAGSRSGGNPEFAASTFLPVLFAPSRRARSLPS